MALAHVKILSMFLLLGGGIILPTVCFHAPHRILPHGVGSSIPSSYPTSPFGVRHRHGKHSSSCPRLLPSSQTFHTSTALQAVSPLRESARRAVSKFRARPGTYLIIPLIAAVVGWVTNWMAVQMIFYPIEFRGIPIWRRAEVPFGLLGWQGIVPCKTRPMTEVMVHMVSTQLLSVKEVFGRLDPREMGKLLAPELPQLTNQILADMSSKSTTPSTMGWLASIVNDGLNRFGLLNHWHRQFIEKFTVLLQRNIESVFDLRNCVVQQMLQDRGKLGELFRKCGQKELDFLTNSGAWFGFLLGIIQMGVALLWDNPWTLSVGGLIVGYATNWLALKWIFQPVDPVSLGPFTLQGMFLRRQPEVAREFSQFFANHILTAEQLWKSLLTDSTTRPALGVLLQQNIAQFLGLAGRWIPHESLSSLADAVLHRLPLYVSPSYQYMDKTLGLEDTLRVRMEGMSSRQFERVLHPIFEEDELTLIIAGAVLGFAAGLVQQGLETGAIKLPILKVGKRLSRRIKIGWWKLRKHWR